MAERTRPGLLSTIAVGGVVAVGLVAIAHLVDPPPPIPPPPPPLPVRDDPPRRFTHPGEAFDLISAIAQAVYPKHFVATCETAANILHYVFTGKCRPAPTEPPARS